jgi:hypothetical protein
MRWSSASVEWRLKLNRGFRARRTPLLDEPGYWWIDFLATEYGGSVHDWRIAQKAFCLVHSRFANKLEILMTIEVIKKTRPDAGCMRCGSAYTGSVEHTVMCFRLNNNGMPCNGRITWRPNPEDWTECPVCAGSGLNDNGRCARCHGDGWLMGKH